MKFISILKKLFFKYFAVKTMQTEIAFTKAKKQVEKHTLMELAEQKRQRKREKALQNAKHGAMVLG